MLAQLQRVSVTLGGKTLLDEASLHLEEGDRIGLIGPNGAGKSTLLRLLAREQSVDTGDVALRRGVRIGYLPQDIVVQDDLALLEYVLRSQPERAALESDLESATEQLEKASEHAADTEETLALAETVAALHERIAHFEQHFSERSAKRILGGLGFSAADQNRGLHEFSGGWKMRGLLASLLFQQPDLLLLDEPTNHLDMPSVAWLSQFLRQHRNAFLLVSHDPEFLNEQVDRIVSFEPEGLRAYRGNYEEYQKQREQELEVLRGRVRNIERERAEAQRFIDRFRAKNTKARQVQSRIKALEKLDDIQLPQERKSLSFKFASTKKPAREALRIRELSHAFGSLSVLRDVSLTLERGDRVAILGPNGAGKTTLLRIAAGELEPTSGSVRAGRDVDLAYFAQHHADALAPEYTLREQVKAFAGPATDGLVRGVCGIMHFDDTDMDKKIKVLSGGERARVALSQLLLSEGNLFLIDEPTNHLDLASSESLIQALASYEGTLVFVSHNKAFVRALATKLWIVADGSVDVYPGSFDDYLWSCQERDDTPVTDMQAPTAPKRDKRGDRKARKREEAELRAKRRAALGPLEKRARDLETQIAALEEQKKESERLLGDPALYQDAERRAEVSKTYAETGRELDALTEAWVELQQEIDEASASLSD